MTKLLLIGPSGTGKSGSLVSLIEAGYKVRILDYDNGLDVVKSVLIKKGRTDLLANVIYEPLRDERGFVGTKIVPKTATAFQNGMRLLDNWPGLGPVSKWGSDCILVVDSLTLMSQAALQQVLALNARLGGTAELQDWGKAQDAIENVLSLLTGNQTKCNVIVMSHVAFIDDANGISQGYPMSLGKSLSPKIGNYFNTCLMTKLIGTGQTAKRIIRTVPDGSITGLKHSIPGQIPVELPIETGLATFFAATKTPTAQAPQQGTPTPPPPRPATTTASPPQ